MKIKSQRDFFAGLMFLAIGVAFAWGATTYNVGVGARMGPGYFPLMLGILLAALGAFIVFEAMVVETEDGEPVGSWAWRPLIFILGANVGFGILLAGLPKFGLPAMGLVVGIFALIAIASMAQKNQSALDTWVGAAIGLALGVLVVAVVGHYFVLFMAPGVETSAQMAKESGGLLKAWVALAQIGGRLAALFLVGYVFHRFVPLKKSMKDIAFLTLALIAISVWSFISLLSLQFPVWPSFVTR